MDKYSHAGYVAWFGLIEIICKENKYNITGDLEISPIYLKRKLRISTAKLEQIFDFCQTKRKLLFNISKEKWVFKFSKVAELKDNYTKNLQATGKKVSLEVEEDKKKKENKTFSSDSNEFRLAELLFKEVRSNNPNCLEANLQSWAKVIDLMIRRDKRKPEEIKKVILWSQQDTFWLQNIRSTEKLRKQYDQLILKMGGKSKGSNDWMRPGSGITGIYE
jgi:hypothetical protein